MAIVADSGALYALYDADDAHHAAVKAVVQKERGPIILPTAILAEVDYLLHEYLGIQAELDFLEGISSGAYKLEPFTLDDVRRCQELITQFKDLRLGLVDSAVAAAAERLRIRRILTVDKRHFQLLRTRKNERFMILPNGE